jgi:hypothetical protein
MAASKKEIGEWFQQGVSDGASHMLVVCDTFDFDDYPVFVPPGVDPEGVVKDYNGKEMQRVMEVYDLNLDRHVQLGQVRVWNTGMQTNG